MTPQLYFIFLSQTTPLLSVIGPVGSGKVRLMKCKIIIFYTSSSYFLMFSVFLFSLSVVYSATMSAWRVGIVGWLHD